MINHSLQCHIKCSFIDTKLQLCHCSILNSICQGTKQRSCKLRPKIETDGKFIDVSSRGTTAFPVGKGGAASLCLSPPLLPPLLFLLFAPSLVPFPSLLPVPLAGSLERLVCTKVSCTPKHKGGRARGTEVLK